METARGARRRPGGGDKLAVAPPLLPPPFAFVSQWLPSGATATALREAVYFPAYQHAHPIVVLAAWALLLFAAMLVVAHPARQEPGRLLSACPAGNRGQPAASSSMTCSTM